MIQQHFYDPLYGRVEIRPNIRPLVFSPEFQRLRYIRLCNINSLFLLGASEPKRFEHCIGVYHLAKRWGTRAQLQPQQMNVLCAAALLHDIQTGPFGHSFQYVLEDNPMDDLFEHSNIDRGLRTQFNQRVRAGVAFAGRPFAAAETLGADGPAVFAAIQGEGPFGPLISGTLDFDNLDNVVRLAFHTGFCQDNDRSLPEQLTAELRLVDGRLAGTSRAEALIQRWFEIRCDLYKHLLFDFGEFSAKAMLTNATELAIDAQLIGADSWLLTDEELLHLLEESSIGGQQIIGQVVRRLRLGDLFRPIGVWTSINVGPYNDVNTAKSKRYIEHRIEQIASESDKIRIRCCVHFIKDHKKTRRSVTYFDIDRREYNTIGDDSEQLLMGVFITNVRAAEYSEQELARLKETAALALMQFGLTNLVESQNPLAYENHDPQQELFV